jgi:LuxR family maltose regulon positive regulatory protein
VLDPRLAQARVFLSQGRDASTEKASMLIEELRAYCSRIRNWPLLMHVEVLSALLDERQGKHEGALARVERLVLDAEPEGWVRIFAHLGEPMERLLRQLAARRFAPHATTRLLDAFPTRDDLSASLHQDELAEPLSERELEVLAFLAERDSNKEIAAQLFIAPSTVKRHTLNIYRKLEVNDRREAAARAVVLGLLPTPRPVS